MNKIKAPSWPATLLDTDWKKKSKAVEKTGIGETLRAAKKLYDLVRWDYIKNFESFYAAAQMLEGEKNKRIGEFWAGFLIKNLEPLHKSLDTVSKTATDWKKGVKAIDAQIKEAIDAATVIAIHASDLAKELDSIDTKIRQNLVEIEAQPAVLAPSGKVITETYTRTIDPIKNSALKKYVKAEASSVTVKYSHADFGGKENPVFAQLVIDRIQKVTDRVPERIEKFIAVTIKDESDKKRAQKLITTYVEEQIKLAADKAQQAPGVIWDEYIAGRKEYNAFKKEVATTVIKEVGSVGLSIGGLAAGTTTGGLSTVLAAIKLVNSFITMAKLLRKVLIDANTAGKDATKELDKLIKDYMEKEKSLWQDYAKDVGNTLITSFINLPIFTTIDTADEKLTLWSQKTSGALVAGVKGGTSLQKALDGLDEVGRELRKLTGSKGDKKVQEALKVMEKLQGKMMSSIEAIEKTMELYTNNRSNVKKAKKVMELLKSSRRETVPLAADLFKRAIPILVNLPFLVIDPAEAALSWTETGYDLTTQLIDFTQQAYAEAQSA